MKSKFIIMILLIPATLAAQSEPHNFWDYIFNSQKIIRARQERVFGSNAYNLNLSMAWYVYDVFNEPGENHDKYPDQPYQKEYQDIKLDFLRMGINFKQNTNEHIFLPNFSLLSFEGNLLMPYSNSSIVMGFDLFDFQNDVESLKDYYWFKLSVGGGFAMGTDVEKNSSIDAIVDLGLTSYEPDKQFWNFSTDKINNYNSADLALKFRYRLFIDPFEIKLNLNNRCLVSNPSLFILEQKLKINFFNSMIINATNIDYPTTKFYYSFTIYGEISNLVLIQNDLNQNIIKLVLSIDYVLPGFPILR